MADNNVTGNEEKRKRVEILEDVARLEKRRSEVLAMKKSATKDYNDQIKDLDEEIKARLLELEA